MKIKEAIEQGVIASITPAKYLPTQLEEWVILTGRKDSSRPTFLTGEIIRILDVKESGVNK